MIRILLHGHGADDRFAVNDDIRVVSRDSDLVDGSSDRVNRHVRSLHIDAADRALHIDVV